MTGARSLLRATIWLGLATTAVARAAEPPSLTVTVEGLLPGGRLPLSAAYCAPPHVEPSQHNISPAVSWSRGPQGTRSYVLIMTDLDVPKDLSLYNKPGITLTAVAERVAFIHWVLVDIPPTITRLARGAEGLGYPSNPKPIGATDHGVRGANVMTFFKPKDARHPQPRGGYDGPCPPMNDVVPHRYVTFVYALDIQTLGLRGVFYGEDALKRMRGHVLAAGKAEAVYVLPVDEDNNRRVDDVPAANQLQTQPQQAQQ